MGVCTVDGSNVARGRLAIRHDLVWDEHGLCCGGGKAGLPGKFGQEIPDAIMPRSWCVDLWRSTLRVGHEGLAGVCIACPPGRFGRIVSCARGRVSKALAESLSKDWIQQGGLPSAGQTVEPFTMSTVAVRLCWVVSW